MRLLILLCMLPVVAFAQITLQASGQTSVFTLTAGAKAGWNNPGTSVEVAAIAPVLSAFRVNAAGNGLFVQTGAKGMIRLFDVRGSLAAALTVERDGFIALSRGLANGVYAARFDAPSMTVRTTRLAVVR